MDAIARRHWLAAGIGAVAGLLLGGAYRQTNVAGHIQNRAHDRAKPHTFRPTTLRLSFRVFPCVSENLRITSKSAQLVRDSEQAMSHPATQEATRSPSALAGSGRVPWWLGFAVALVFILFAVHFVRTPNRLDIPVSGTLDAGIIPQGALSTAPRRTILQDPPTRFIAGFDRTCMDCHRTFPPREDPPVALLQHKHIVLDHGINSRCSDCHYPVDRNRLKMHDGTVVGYDEVVKLCSKCHGPTYRDWQHGAHGRTNGYWDSTAGEQIRLKCTECHDPHMPRVPAMDPIQPLPGPHTLRMGDQRKDPHQELETQRDPLIRALHEVEPHSQGREKE